MTHHINVFRDLGGRQKLLTDFHQRSLLNLILKWL